MPELLLAVAAKAGVANDFPTIGGITILLGHVMTGLVLSITVMENEQLTCNEYEFVAVQVTELNPRGKTYPDDGLHATEGVIPLGSDADAVKVATEDGAPPDVGKVCELGHVMVGGENWLTITKNVQDFELKALSNEVHVTEVAPAENWVPEGGVHDVLRMPLPSVAVDEIS